MAVKRKISDIPGAHAFLIKTFDDVYDETVEEFIKKTRKYFEKNKAKIIEQRIVKIYEQVDPASLRVDIKVFLQKI